MRPRPGAPPLPPLPGSAVDRLQALHVFTRVARLGSFSAAARELGISAAAVSRNVSSLEARLGVQLLRRTTRSLSRTEAGDRCLARAEALLDQLNALEDEVRGTEDALRGRLRITTGVAFCERHLGAALARFQSAHPELSLEIVLTDTALDLVEQGIDLAVRIGRLPDSSLKARRICAVHQVFVCSPGYADEHGVPETPADLGDHPLLVDTNTARPWVLAGPGGDICHHDPDACFSINSAPVVQDACHAGLGIGLVPTFVCGPALAAGTLRRVLPDWTSAELAMYAVFPARRHVSAPVRALIDFLLEAFGGPSAWDAGIPGTLPA